MNMGKKNDQSKVKEKNSINNNPKLPYLGKELAVLPRTYLNHQAGKTRRCYFLVILQ